MKLKKYFILSVAVLYFGLLGCAQPHQGPALTEEELLAQKYQMAVADAQVAEADEIYPSLNPILETNPKLTQQDVSGNHYVLMVTFTKYASSYPVNQAVTTNWGYTWVTVYPDLKNKIAQGNIPKNALSLRVKELLGLPYTSGNTNIVEVWVKPTDLFRPCPDNEITDTVAELDFPPSAEPGYMRWFNNNKNYASTGYPWTRLGYTYDWGGDSEIGLSEYVITKNAVIIIKSNQVVENYFEN